MEKDFKPIWIYLLITTVGSFLLGFVYALINILTGTEKMNLDLCVFLLNIIILIIFAVIYRKKIIEDFKKPTMKNWLVIILIGLFTTGVNYLLTLLIEVDNSNQNTVIDLVENYPIISSLVTILVAPIIEEFVFRYSFSTFIKNKWIYIALTSIIFGFVHTANLDVIIYIFIGIMLSLTYLKFDKRISAPIVVHMINNLISVVMILLGL